MIKIRIRNADHEIDVQFPISENKLYAKLAEIHAIEGKDAPQSRKTLCMSANKTVRFSFHRFVLPIPVSVTARLTVW